MQWWSPMGSWWWLPIGCSWYWFLDGHFKPVKTHWWYFRWMIKRRFPCLTGLHKGQNALKIMLLKIRTAPRYPGFSGRFWLSYLTSLHNGKKKKKNFNDYYWYKIISHQFNVFEDSYLFLSLGIRWQDFFFAILWLVLLAPILAPIIWPKGLSSL